MFLHFFYNVRSENFEDWYCISLQGGRSQEICVRPAVLMLNLQTASPVPTEATMGSCQIRIIRFAFICTLAILVFLVSQLIAKDKKDGLQYGVGLIVNVPSHEADVLKAVDEVAQNGKINGTKEYAKDEFVGGANEVNDSTAFPAWTEGGKVFYKQRANALDPRNFKDSSDVGTLTVRYVVIHQDDTHTVLRIDAVFVEAFRRKTHPSDGSVETAEYKEIHDRLEGMQSMKDQAAEAEREKQRVTQNKFQSTANTALADVPAAADLGPRQAQGAASQTAQPVTQQLETATSESSSIEDLKKRLHELQQQTEKRVKTSGTTLKSAPFRTATSLRTLGGGTEVLVVISSTYWFGVETRDGQHGWILRDDLEELP